VASTSTSIGAAAVTDEEVSEADIVATVAALKTIRTQRHPSDTRAVAVQSALAPLPSSSPSSTTKTLGGTSSNAVAASLSITPTTTTAGAAKPKPVIFSHQWRRRLFASAGGASLPLPVQPGKKAKQAEQRGGRKSSSSSSSADEDADGNEGDECAFPFGNASVIKFSKTEGECGLFGGQSGATGLLTSRSCSSASDHSDSDDDAVMRLVDERDGGGAAPPPLSRHERHALRQRALEAREKKRVQRHMSGFDKDFLRHQEAQLLEVSEEENDVGSDSVADGAETGSGSTSSFGDSADGSAEDEGRDDDNEENASTSSGSSIDGERSGKDDAHGSTAQPTEGGEAVKDVSAAGEKHSSHCGGFGAMNRARAGLQRTHEKHDKSSHEDEGTTPSTASSPGPLSLLASAGVVGARSHWLDTFFFAVHENRLHRDGCHHTLMGLRGPVTIHGPCGLIGFGLGEVCVNGFYLGKKQMNLWHEEHHAVLMPMKKLKTKHAQDVELPQWTHVPDPMWPPGQSQQSSPTSPVTGSGGVELRLGRPLNASHFAIASPPPHQQPQQQPTPVNVSPATQDKDDDEEGFLQSLQWDCEAVFGGIDWDWVEATVQSWRGLFSNKLPPILLVVQPSSSVVRPRGVPGPMRKFYLSRKRHRSGRGKARGEPVGAYMDIPSFVAHRNTTSVDLAVLPSIVPSVAAQGCGCVMVLGSANIGKSTLCRFLTNVLLSQHGLCYWLDLDLGQPEFGVPGQLSLIQVRRPLLRECDSSCVRTVAALFIGANTAVQCPVSTANALATICAQAAAVAKDHPVVVNTHGWVLQTGRRVSVEALRRLRPRQVIHLYKEKEEAWAQDTAALLDPRNGLNADVVQRRFLVRHGVAASQVGAGNTMKGCASLKRNKGSPATSKPAASLLCRLPLPHAFDFASSESPVLSPTSPGSRNNAKRKGDGSGATASQQWRGQVHAVRVEREESYSSLQLLKETKGSRGRQQRWQTYFAPLLRFYTERRAGQGGRQEGTQNKTTVESETTLLEAPLSALRFIVLAERDEKAGDAALFPSNADVTSAPSVPVAQQLHAEVAAALEHAVVAVLFHVPSDTSLSTPSTSSSSSFSPNNGCCVVRSLASLSCGFPITCYGVVESSERELLHGMEPTEGGDGTGGGWIRIRVPLRPAVVAAMLEASNTSTRAEKGCPAATVVACGGTTQVSIAYSAAMRHDTAFMEV
jgi:polynucleotide 5'-hydroxyl-kinase GRC3/NOL9